MIKECSDNFNSYLWFRFSNIQIILISIFDLSIYKNVCINFINGLISKHIHVTDYNLFLYILKSIMPILLVISLVIDNIYQLIKKSFKLNFWRNIFWGWIFTIRIKTFQATYQNILESTILDSTQSITLM
jgi:hypothetical protein